MMEKSSFLIEEQFDNKIFLWQTRTRKKFVLSSNTWEKLNNGICFISDSLELLEEACVFVDSAKAERDQYLRMFFKNLRRLDNNILSLTIAPTLNCNLACRYCFQKEINHLSKYKNSASQPNINNSILGLIKDSIDSGVIDTVSLSFYGGEPLLKYNDILDFTRKAQYLCNDKEIRLTKRITTNGTLLSEKMAIELSKENFTFYFTIDIQSTFTKGDRLFHNGADSYELVNKNAIIASKYGKVNFNIVCSNEMLKQHNQWENDVCNWFKNYNRNNLWITLSPEVESSDSPKIKDSNLIENISQFLFLHEKLLNLGYRVKCSDETLCPATIKNHFVIDPLGIVSKCSARIGFDNFTIGTLSSESDFLNISREDDIWLDMLDSEIPEICKKCALFPICGGGCLADNRNICGDFFDSGCQKDKKIRLKAKLSAADFNLHFNEY